jgi:two-component system OmpR family sensor kinase
MVLLVALVSALVVLTTTLAMQDYLLGKRDQEVAQSLNRAVNPRPGGPGGPPGRRGEAEDDGDGDSYFGQRSGSVLLRVAGGTPSGLLITEAGGVRSISTAAAEELSDVPKDGKAHSVELPYGRYRVMSGVSSDGDTWVVGLPQRDIQDIISSLVFWATLLALGGVLLAAVAGRMLVRRQLRPLREVAATAHRVSQQPLSTGDPDLSTRVEETLTDPTTEVGQVGHALNTLLDHMAAALEARHASEQQVRQFVADASHELRTPLSTIHGYAELSRRTPDDSVALSAALAKVETEADRMSALVEDLLLLARLDAGRPLEREEVDVTRLLLESVADARVVAPDHRWRLELPEEPVSIEGDEHRLHQVVTNLLGNARHHTPPGTTVTVSSRVTDDAVVVAVHDDGPGLPAGLATHAFERFTRGDSSRTRASGGAGLGLSLVDAITVAHGGRAGVDSEPGSTTFTLTLPR